MSRFSNLELDSVVHPVATNITGISDETRCMAEAEAAFGRGDFEPALRWFARTLEFNPQNVAAWTGQVQALIEMGQFAEGKVWATKALEKFPNAPELLAAKAVTLGRLGHTDDALAFSDASLEKPGESSYVWLARGDVLLARRERHADACFERAVQAAPNNWWIRWMGGRIRMFWDQFAAALALAQQAAKLAPERAVTWLLAGEAQLSLGMHDSAAVAFRQALALAPDCRAAEAGLNRLAGSNVLERCWQSIAGWVRRD